MAAHLITGLPQAIGRVGPAPAPNDGRRHKGHPRLARRNRDTARTMAGLIGLVLLALEHPLAATIIVSADGTGDVTTVSAACSLAVSGDQILIMPGYYDEFAGPDGMIAVRDKSLELRGQGATPEEVRLRLSIWFWRPEALTIERLTFQDAYQPVVVFDGGTVTVTSCRFERNQGHPLWSKGGGAYLQGRSLIVDGSVFLENRAMGDWGEGGGVRLGTQGSALVRDCWFVDNEALEVAGGLSASGGATVEDCVFFRNAAPTGAGAALGPSSRISGCTFLKNRVTGEVGGALFQYESTHWDIGHCLIAWTEGGYGFHTLSVVDFRCTDMWMNEKGIGVGVFSFWEHFGNFEADPLLCDIESGDLGLMPGSPCLPGNHGGMECGLIGAKGLGCGQVPVVETTWGRLKMSYR